MEINNVFSPVPFYKNKKYWHSNKWYTYGQKCPIMMTSQNTLPFQLVVDSGVTLSSFAIKKADNDTVVRTVSTSGNYASIPGESYNVIQVKACAISALPYGNYYYALTLSDGSTYISDIIAIISDMSKCIKITYKNVENLYFSSGHIDFSNDFVFELYLPTTIGKPEYEYEEELTKRLGYKFLESQVVNKVYKFTFPATEQMCDAYRFVRMCDYIRIDTYNPDLSEYDHYNVIYLSSEVDWLDNGDIASIETSFETDSIVQKLQDYSRTQLVNFYNALLSNSDEVLKFDDETIAQYYNNYIQSIDGKMIRQLDAASSISDNTVIAIDENNGIGAAKKILLKPLITSVIGDELRASEVLQNFQAHISNADIHITAQERALLSLFALDENGDVYLKDKRGFYSNSFISAKGKSDGGSSPSGASALYQLVDVEKNNTDDGVYGAEAGKVLMYNGTKWYAGTVNTGLDEKALKTYLDANKYTTTSYVDSKVSEVSTELNNLLQGTLNNKVDTAFFARVFGLLDANGNEIAVNDVTTVADSIKAKFGLWTEQYLSAKGKNDNTSGSASALYQLVDILSNDTNDGVYGAEVGKVLMYNGTKWYAGTVNTGLDEKALKTYLDANKYTTASYVDSKVSAVSTKLDNFLEGSDTDGIINKWKELEAFLAGQTQTSTLAELLAVKADKSTKIVAGAGLTGGGDLSSNVTLSLASSGVTAGIYTKVTVDAYGRVTTGATLSSSDIPNIAISQVNGLQTALNNKVDTAFFARVFGLLDANGNEIAVNDVTTVADSIKAKFGLWTEQYISALGKNPSSSGGSGASALYQLVDILPNAANDGVYGASTGKVLMYNGSKWQAGNVVSDISTLTFNVNGSKLFDYNGKFAVTANLTVPTKLSQLTNDSGYLTSITKSMVEGVLTGNITSHTHSYLPLSGGAITGITTFNINNTWLTPSVLQIGRIDTSKDAAKAVIGVTDGNLHIDAYHGKVLYLNYYNNGQIRFGYQTGSYYISEDGSYYSGNAATATALTTSAGSATLPIYFSSGKPVACTASSVFSNLSNSGNSLSVTVAGQNRTLTVNYASNADKLDNTDSTGFFRYFHISYFQNKDLNYANNAYGTWNHGDDSTQKNTPTTSYGCYLSWGNLASSDTSTTRNQTAQIGVNCWEDLGRIYVRARQAGNRDVTSIGNWRTVAFITDNIASATKLQTARTITLKGSVTGSVSFDGTSNVSIFTSTNHTHSFESLTSKPTTISGYGITDAYTSSTIDSKLSGYLPLSGGTINGGSGVYTPLVVKNNISEVWIAFQDNVGTAYIGSSNGIPSIYLGSGSGPNKVIIHSGNYNSYTPTLTGAGASGTWGINISGNAGSVNTLSALLNWTGDVNSLDNYVSAGKLYSATNAPLRYYSFLSFGANGYLTQINCRGDEYYMRSKSESGWHDWHSLYHSGNCNNASTQWSCSNLTANGNISATGAVTAKASSSDIRLKTDIADYKALSIIRNHRSIKYHWNEAAKANADIFNDNDWHFGLIAQEMQQDLPQMVSDVFKDYLVINYERLIPICWKGLQEVDDEVTRLKKKVRKLEMEIRELKQERI